MSGTASLSAAKNRRSGNEVKFNGQSKQPMPPQNTRPPSQPQQCSRQGGQQQCGQQPPIQSPMQPQTQFIPPHPLVLLKSHELRLQKIEASASLSPKEDESSQMANDFVSHKQDYDLFKQSVTTAKSAENNRVIQLETVVQAQMKKISQLESNLAILNNKMSESYRFFQALSTQVANINVSLQKPSQVEIKDKPVMDIACEVIACEVKALDKLEEINITFEVLDSNLTTAL